MYVMWLTDVGAASLNVVHYLCVVPIRYFGRFKGADGVFLRGRLDVLAEIGSVIKAYGYV